MHLSALTRGEDMLIARVHMVLEVHRSPFLRSTVQIPSLLSYSGALWIGIDLAERLR